MNQLDIYSAQIQSVYIALEDEIINSLINRLSTSEIPSGGTGIYTWQVEKLNQLHALNDDMVKLIANRTGKNESIIRKMILDGGYEIANETNGLISNALNSSELPIDSDIDLILRNMVKQTFLDIDNFVNQTLIDTNFGQGIVSRTYQGILEQMVADTVTGVKTAKQSLSNSIYKLIDGGIKSGFVDKGGHQWSIEAYTRTVLDSTKYRVMNETRMEQAGEYGVHTFVMSSHPASRPACAPIQGKVVNDVPKSSSYYDPRYPSIYDHGYGSAGGTFGINCHHMKFPFVPGVNINNQPQYDPEEAIKNGEIQQKQRRLERAIRNSKRKLKAATQLGDEGGINHFKSLISGQQSAMRKLVNDNSFLHRDYSKEKSYTQDTAGEMKSLLRRSEVNPDIFNRHVLGTYEYEEKSRIRLSKGLKAASWLTIDSIEAQELVNKYGVKDSRTLSTRFKHSDNIGIYVDQKTGEELPTKLGKITYSKTGAHITPFDPRKE